MTNLPVLDQGTFPPVDDSGFTLIGELPVFQDALALENVELDSVIAWTPIGLGVPTAPAMQVLVAKTDVDFPIEETIYLFSDAAPEMEAPVMTVFQYIDGSPVEKAVYRIYAKALDPSVTILPSALYSMTAKAFK